MSTRTAVWTRFLALGAAVCLSLTACGGLNFGQPEEPTPEPAEKIDPGPEPEPEPEEEEEKEPEESDEDSRESDGGTAANAEVTPPGTELTFGETAVVTFDNDDVDEPGNIEVTPISITKGAPEDLEEINLGESAAGMVPYYITVRVTGHDETAANVRGTSINADLEPVNANGHELQSLIVIGSWDKCPRKSFYNDFDEGVTFETCVVGLSADEDVTGVKYGPRRTDYQRNPIVWQE